MTSTDTLRVELQDGLAIVSLAQPARGNPFDGAFGRDFKQVASDLLNCTDLRAVLLRAEGANFSFGGDLKAFYPARDRLALGPNDSGIRFEIEFIGSLNPHEEKAHLRRRDGRVTENMARAQQLGRYSGWLEFDGKRVDIDSASWMGQRDHSWGVRAEMRTDETTPPLTYYPPFFYCWTTAQFANRGLHIFFKERAPGEKIYLSGEEVFAAGNKVSGRSQLVEVRHNARWLDDPHGQSMESAQFQLTFADGSERPLSIRVLPTKYFLKGGLYGGLNGWFHGDDRGKLYFEHDVWDLTDAHTRQRVRTLADQVVEVRDGDEVGYGIIEYGVGKGFGQYESVQGHPPI